MKRCLDGFLGRVSESPALLKWALRSDHLKIDTQTHRTRIKKHTLSRIRRSQGPKLIFYGSCGLRNTLEPRKRTTNTGSKQESHQQELHGDTGARLW